MWSMLVALGLGTAIADPGDAPGPQDRMPVRRQIDGDGWPVGAWVAVALPGVVPCPTAEADGCTGAALSVGLPLIIEAIHEDPLGDGVVRRRYAVSSPTTGPFMDGPRRPMSALLGYLPPEALTQASWQVDLDQDGELERISAHMDSEAHLWLFLQEAKAQAPLALDLGTQSDIGGIMDRVTVGLMSAKEAGLPLVWVNWPANEMCGSGDHSRYASYRSAQAGQPGRLRLALQHSGSGGDAPIWWNTEVAFQPARGTVTVRSTAGEYDNDGGADSIHSDETTRYTLVDGLFVAQPAAP